MRSRRWLSFLIAIWSTEGSTYDSSTDQDGVTVELAAGAAAGAALAGAALAEGADSAGLDAVSADFDSAGAVSEDAPLPLLA